MQFLYGYENHMRIMHNLLPTKKVSFSLGFFGSGKSGAIISTISSKSVLDSSWSSTKSLNSAKVAIFVPINLICSIYKTKLLRF